MLQFIDSTINVGCISIILWYPGGRSFEYKEDMNLSLIQPSVKFITISL